MVDPLLTLGKLLFSSLLGGLVGLEREFSRTKRKIPIGVRTMILITVFGTLTVLLNELIGTDLFMIIGLLGVLLLVALSFYARQSKGLTTYTASFIMYLVGVVIGYNEFLVGVIIAVITAALLSFKSELHRIAKVMTRKELKSTILFAIISLIILPLLPDSTIDWLGVFNPFRFWLIVVVISSISFTSYLLLKVFKRGLAVTGFLGGFLSAKLTSYQLVKKASKNHELRDPSFNGVLLSIASSLISISVIALTATLNLTVFFELVTPLLLSSGLVLVVFYRRNGDRSVEELRVSNPFSLTSALKIAFLIFLFTEGIYLLQYLIHSSMVYPATALSAMISSFATTASLASLNNNGVVGAGLMTDLVILTSGITVFLKILFVKMGGDDELFKDLLKPLLLWSGLLFAYFIVRKILPI